MKFIIKKIFLLLVVLTTLVFSNLQALADQPKVGRKAAAKYFQAQNKNQGDSVEPRFATRNPANLETLDSSDHYLTVSLGKMTQSDAYNWGINSKETDLGGMVFDLTYRLTMDSTLYDQGVRISYADYKPAGQRAQKLSFMYAMLLPDAGSQFPLYFGMAFGPGIFMKQLQNESAITLDYQLLLGLRLFNVFEKSGFSIEGGLRNHLQLTSDGQFNSVYATAGAVFTF
jgi:opacity protein-like surface antigen